MSQIDYLIAMLIFALTLATLLVLKDLYENTLSGTVRPVLYLLVSALVTILYFIH